MNGSYTVSSQRRQFSDSVRYRPARARRHQGLSPFEILTLLAIAVLLIAGALAARPSADAINAGRPIQVKVGETLWSIAQSHPIAGLTTAQTAESIARTNGLTTGTLRVGQTLLVPVDAESVPQMASR